MKCEWKERCCATCFFLILHMCHVTHPYTWRDSFICVSQLTHNMTRLIRMRDINNSYAWHDLFLHVTWIIDVQNTNHLRARLDSLKYVTWLIQYAWRDSCIILILKRAFYLRQIALDLCKRALYLQKIPISLQNALFFCKSALFSHKSARFDFSTKALAKNERKVLSVST